MKTMKKIRYMSKPELEAIYEEFNIPTQNPDTGKDLSKTELAFDLKNVYGIDDEKLKSYREKKDTELVDGKDEYSEFVEDEKSGTVVVCMDRQNSSFGIGKKIFTKNARYQIVTEAEARTLLNLGGFHKATREEIARAFK